MSNYPDGCDTDYYIEGIRMDDDEQGDDPQPSAYLVELADSFNFDISCAVNEAASSLAESGLSVPNELKDALFWVIANQLRAHFDTVERFEEAKEFGLLGFKAIRYEQIIEDRAIRYRPVPTNPATHAAVGKPL